jgi:hypothetical protein
MEVPVEALDIPVPWSVPVLPVKEITVDSDMIAGTPR